MAGRKPKSPNEGFSTKGVQSIHRAVSLLRLVVKNNERGIGLPELAYQIGLHEATARRMLKALEAEGMITYDPDSRLYHLGIELYLFEAAAHQFNIRDTYRYTLERIADKTEDTVFLVIRSGYDALVIDRLEGAFPIRTLTHEVGQRVPLGIGAGSTTLLASLSQKEIDNVIAINRKRYEKYNDRTPDLVKKQIESCRKKGYALSIGNMMPEAIAVGCPIVNQNGQVVAAISVAAIFQRMKPKRREWIAELIASEIEAASTSAEKDVVKSNHRQKRKP